MARYQRAAVLHVRRALQHRLEQIANDAGDDDAEAQARVPVPGEIGQPIRASDREKQRRDHESADRAFARLTDAVARAQAAGELGAEHAVADMAAGWWALLHGTADLVLGERLERAVGERVLSAYWLSFRVAR